MSKERLDDSAVMRARNNSAACPKEDVITCVATTDSNDTCQNETEWMHCGNIGKTFCFSRDGVCVTVLNEQVQETCRVKLCSLS